MNGEEQNHKNAFVWSVIGAAVLVVLAALALYLLNSGKVRPPESGVAGPALPPEEAQFRRALETSPVYQLSGRIAKREGDAITLDVPNILGVTILPDSPRRTRTVLVTSRTSLYEEIEKSEVQFEKELRAYNLKPTEAGPPTLTTTRTISAVDLKIGDALLVKMGDGIDLKDAATIRATEIVRTGTLRSP